MLPDNNPRLLDGPLRVLVVDDHQILLRALEDWLSGVPLVKVVTTIGKPGVAVAAITRRPQGYVVSHVDGSARATLNGSPVGSDAVPLKSGDLIELAGIQMQFSQG